MNMPSVNEQSQIIASDSDVINLGQGSDKFFIPEPMFEVGDFLQEVKQKLLHMNGNDWTKNDGWVESRKEWIQEGKACEFLQLGGKLWKKGRVKIRITVEFYPQEPESPLDDVRQAIAEN
ncbi:MAG: hypothetical protein HC890_10425 [Chloroflexaceae bacterium]|nr:hypothetical protein [Chloroflexaceae bacterium]